MTLLRLAIHLFLYNVIINQRMCCCLLGFLILQICLFRNLAKRKPRNILIIFWKKNSGQISKFLPHEVFVVVVVVVVVLPIGIRTIANVHIV